MGESWGESLRLNYTDGEHQIQEPEKFPGSGGTEGWERGGGRYGGQVAEMDQVKPSPSARRHDRRWRTGVGGAKVSKKDSTPNGGEQRFRWFFFVCFFLLNCQENVEMMKKRKQQKGEEMRGGSNSTWRRWRRR